MFWISGIAAILIAIIIWGAARQILTIPITILFGDRLFFRPPIFALINVVAATCAVHFSMWLVKTYFVATSVYFFVMAAAIVFFTQSKQSVENANAAWQKEDLVIDDNASDEENAYLRVLMVQSLGRWQIAGSLVGFGIAIVMYIVRFG